MIRADRITEMSGSQRGLFNAIRNQRTLVLLLAGCLLSGCDATSTAPVSGVSAAADIGTPDNVQQRVSGLELAASSPPADATDPARPQPPSSITDRRSQLAAETFLASLTQAVAVGWWTPQRGQRRRDASDRNGVPQWAFDPTFASEAFRFVRVRFNSRGGYGPFGKWFTDYPDSDLNFSFRLQQLTTMNVHPEPLYLDLTDPKIFDYPFMYMIEPGFIYLSDAEVIAMREYFERGGFIMVDDFWGEEEWYNFYLQMKRVFPDREPIELPLDHQIFHLVYDLKQKPQVPSIHNWMRYGVTYERPDAKEVHYRAFHDDEGRIAMMICHNTDLGDGWEREGESREYFETFSEKWAYPMGINIVVYAMTH